MSYPKFDALMATELLSGYQWEPLTVTTSDNYVLTLFHVWSDEKRDASKGPILF